MWEKFTNKMYFFQLLLSHEDTARKGAKLKLALFFSIYVSQHSGLLSKVTFFDKF